MTFKHFSLLCLISLAVDHSFGGSLSGTFESCQISCNNDGDQVPMPSPTGSVRVGKKGPKGSKGERGSPGHNCECSNLVQVLTQLQELEENYNELKQQMTELRERLPRSCSAVKRSHPSANDGVYTIYPFTNPTIELSVYCDMTTDGGGWIVMQKRFNGSVDFYRDWSDYVNGFGDKNGEYWLGLENIHLLTMARNMQLRIDLKDFSDNEAYAQYNTFFIGAGDDYTLNFGKYTGNAGDSFGYNNGERHRGARFSTRDKDQDFNNVAQPCAKQWSAGWWFGYCFYANLNGLYVTTENRIKYGDGINWFTWKSEHTPLKASEMKIRLL